MMWHTRLDKLFETRRQTLWIVVCATWLALGGVLPAQAAAPNVNFLAQNSAQATVSLAENALPTRLVIPALGVDAPIEAVGQDDAQFMAAPSDIKHVAWYNLGPRPSETGNAVMAGHLDDSRGRPAVFWDLGKLKAGDEIIVRFDDETEKHFAVISVESYDADEAPLERIFGVDFERDLNLITCAGQWDTKSKLYEKRLVVYSRLIRDVASGDVASGDEAVRGAIDNGEIDNGEIVSGAIVSGEIVSGIDAQPEFVNHATQASTTSTFARPTPPRTSYTRQDREQPLASR